MCSQKIEKSMCDRFVEAMATSDQRPDLADMTVDDSYCPTTPPKQGMRN